MNGFEVLVVIAFIILLIVAICFIVSFYVCDGYNCKAFTVAETEAPRGTKEYALALLPYVAAAIITPFILWFLCIPMTVRAFALIFLVSWIFIYFAFAFLGHHYIRFISLYVSDYIQGACPGDTLTRAGPTYNPDEPPPGPPGPPGPDLSDPSMHSDRGAENRTIASASDSSTRTQARSYPDPGSGSNLTPQYCPARSGSHDSSIPSYSDLLAHNFSVPVNIYA
jgi:hypothetical protein